MEASIIHVPVTSLRENEKLVVEARVDGAGQAVVFMRLYYRSGGQQSYSYVEMSRTAGGFFAELSPQQFTAPQLEYFILALLADESVVTFPKWNPYGNPVKVQVAYGGKQPTPSQEQAIPSLPEPEPETEAAPVTSEPAAEQEAGGPLLILSPEDGEKIGTDEEVVIAVSFVPENDSIDVSSVNLFIDNQNVTRDAEVTEYLLTYSTSGLPPGKHRAMVQGYYASGAQLPAAVWSFEVTGAAEQLYVEPPVRGRVFAESRQENISGVGFSDNNVGGALSGKYGIASYDARVYLTTRESSRFQPRHRFTFNLELPLLGITVGDTYPRFNDLMLWGKRVRGVYGRLHLGFFNTDVVYGQTVREVNPLFTLNSAGQDSVTSFGTHEQNLLGIRQSFGSGKHFQLGFNFLKVRDDTTGSGRGGFSVLPQDNLVLGSDILFAFDNRRFEVRGGAAFSLYTTDTSTGPLSKQEIEDQFDVSLPFDPADLQDIFIINASTTPLDPRDLTSLAYNFNVRLNYFNNDFQFGYKSIGSQYLSLGNSFLRNNLRGFYFNDRFRLLQNRLYLNFGFEHYKDNFDTNDQNPPTNLRTVDTGFSIFPGRNLPTLTFTLRSHNRDNNIDSLFIDLTSTTPDTLDEREDNTTRDVSVQLNYDVHFFNLNHSISVSYITSDRDDRFSFTRADSLNPQETSSNVQVVTVRTKYRFPLMTTVTFARNDNKFGQFVQNGINKFNFKMFGVRADYALLHKKLTPFAALNFTTASGATSLTDSTRTITDYSRTDFSLGFRYEFTPGHFLFAEGHLIRFSDSGGTFDVINKTFLTTNPSFTDRIFRLYYEKRF
ncbi:MAG: hypothetical protein D6743_00500 [Calditrichaeota bacterium]|nr:MAG: hypothetical protein D6743_00500 [Calditrichota bacterium]